MSILEPSALGLASFNSLQLNISRKITFKNVCKNKKTNSISGWFQLTTAVEKKYLPKKRTFG